MGQDEPRSDARKESKSGTFIWNPATDPELAPHLVAARAGKFFVIVDWDHTCSRYLNEDGSVGESTHQVMRKGMDPSFAERFSKLHNTYYAKEHDESISDVDKIPIMEEWYHLTNQVYLDAGLTRADVDRAISLCDVDLRPGTHEFFRLCNEKNVPLIILSAGLQVVIDGLMAKLCPDVKYVCVGNNFQFGDMAPHPLIAVPPPVIHPYNKSFIGLPSEIQTQIIDYTHGMVIGDGKGDAGMAIGHPRAAVYKFGFNNTDPAADPRKAENYRQTFHTVRGQRDGFQDLIALLRLV